MDESQKCIWKVKDAWHKTVHNVWLHLFEILKQEKLIYVGGRNVKSRAGTEENFWGYILIAVWVSQLTCICQNSSNGTLRICTFCYSSLNTFFVKKTFELVLVTCILKWNMLIYTTLKFQKTKKNWGVDRRKDG